MDWLTQELQSLGQFAYILLPTALFAVFMVVLELCFPRQSQKIDPLRWINGGLLLLTQALILTPISALIAAMTAAAAVAGGYGALNAVSLPPWMSVIISFLIYDLLSYGTHRLEHSVPFLWRFHRTHHTDRTVDAATVLRINPFEAAIVAIFTAVVVWGFGVHPMAIVIHASFMFVFNFWHHANIKSLPLQRHLGLVFNIPEFHRLHHSTEQRYHCSNYGTVLSIWDRWLGTLEDDPAAEAQTQHGLPRTYWDQPESFISLLLDPLRSADTPNESFMSTQPPQEDGGIPGGYSADGAITEHLSLKKERIQ